MSGPNDFYGWHVQHRMDPRAIGYRNSEQGARDFENRSRDWEGQPRSRYDHLDYAGRERSPIRDYREWAPPLPFSPPPSFNFTPPSFTVPPRDQFFHEDPFYQQDRDIVNRPREEESERVSGGKAPLDYHNEEETYNRFKKLRDLEERVKWENSQKEEEEEGEFLDLKDGMGEEEFDDEGSKRVKRPWLPGKSQAANSNSVVSKAKGKALKPTRATASAGSSNQDNLSGESLTFIPTAISDEVGIWQTSGLSTDESKAISKKFELVFEDPAFSIKPPRLDGFMLRHAKDKDRVRAVNAAEKAQDNGYCASAFGSLY